MFIFGWGSRASNVERGVFSCPFCRTDTTYLHRRHRTWFTFFFIPILPISSGYDSITCEKCFCNIPLESFQGKATAETANKRLSLAATIGVFLAGLSLLTFCVFFFSFPLSIISVILGHFALRDIRNNKPNVEGHWQAVTALSLGYPALVLSSLIGLAVFFPSIFPFAKNKDSSVARFGEAMRDQSRANRVNVSESATEAFKNAEYEIASKRDKPAGRGNTPKAVELATLFSQRIGEISEEAFTSRGRPIIQLSDGEYLTYCQLQDDSCLFLVHVPSYRKFTGDAKKSLAEISWAVAQSTVAGELQKNSKLGIGLRGVLTYGDIMIGNAANSPDDEIGTYRSGEKEDLIAFFEAKNNAATKSKATAEPASSLESPSISPELDKATPNADSSLPSTATPNTPQDSSIANPPDPNRPETSNKEKQPEPPAPSPAAQSSDLKPMPASADGAKNSTASTVSRRNRTPKNQRSTS